MTGIRRSRVLICIILSWLLFLPAQSRLSEKMTNYSHHAFQGRSLIITSTEEQKLHMTPYGNYIIRVQAVRHNEAFFPDSHYEMVESHDWPGTLQITDRRDFLQIKTAGDGVGVHISKNPLRLAFYGIDRDQPLLKESTGISWEGSKINVSFVHDPDEHFTGLGHGYYGRAKSIDLRGQKIKRNYGSQHWQQAPLLVPFYLSGKGYGVFLNSTFPNSFNFGEDNIYEFGIDDKGFDGRIDYFFITGPDFKKILNRYTQLTGRPRLPPLAIFGLALSDKGHDHTSPTPSDEQWWKNKIMEHRSLGFPLDHVVNDNRWRAGGGQRCQSYFDWDATRYPNPAEYEQWLNANGFVATLDFNRCIARWSSGWDSTFNIPITDSIEFKQSAPDFTRKEVRAWFWNLFWRKSFDPKLGYPGDALWIDEFDEMGKAPLDMILGNGRSWAEMKNYWFYLMAKALVQEGWDTDRAPAKRPFVWVRGMSAGAQRYATLWTGDIRPNYDDMKSQIRALQLAGLSGFPYWGHDAGGFYDYETDQGPDDAMYRQWSMAFGSFTPFWRPHGPGKSRWPADRSHEAQETARLYGKLRYQLMPYIYTYAHEAHVTGVPMARAMVIEHPNEPLAWEYDLQYMWGEEILVAPNPADSGAVPVWLPEGHWYDFWDDTRYTGDQITDYNAPTDKLPLFVKAGSIIPMAPPALSTAFMSRDTLSLHIYIGEDARFVLYEDDGDTEFYITKEEKRVTEFQYDESSSRLTIHAASGTYKNAPKERSYRVTFHGYAKPGSVTLKGKPLPTFDSKSGPLADTHGLFWDAPQKLLTASLRKRPVSEKVVLEVKGEMELNIMSFNIRYGTADDGENSWQHRRQLVFDVFEQNRPDVIGMQEALRFQLDEIRDQFPEYDEIGVGRDDGQTGGEYSPIFYLRPRFNIIHKGTFWFSDTPDVPGSMSWGNEYPRICTWARLQEKETNQRFWIFNVHLDHTAQTSRAKSVVFLSKYIEEKLTDGEPFVVTGDFNAGENNPAILYLKGEHEMDDAEESVAKPTIPLVDTYRLAHPRAGAVGTFNEFRGKKTGDKIDYIFVPDGVTVLEAEIVRFQKGGRYPSDHFAVTARILMPKEIEP